MIPQILRNQVASDISHFHKAAGLKWSKYVEIHAFDVDLRVICSLGTLHLFVD
jgi:hypothetical protein